MSLPDLSLIAKLLGIFLCGVSLFLLYRLIQRWAGKGPTDGGLPVTDIPDVLDVEPKIFMTQDEAALFNLVYLAVQDSYLVFAKVPLRNILKMTPRDEASRKVALRTGQKFYADIVLVHPGTRVPQKVILVSTAEFGYQNSGEDEGIIEALFHEAGIEIIRLERDRTYSVPELIAVLGLEEDN